MRLPILSSIVAVAILSTLRVGVAAEDQDATRGKLWQALRADWPKEYGKMDIQAYGENDKLDEVLLVCRGDALLYRLQTRKFAILQRSRELGPINRITFECGKHRRWRMWVSGEVAYTLPCEQPVAK
jgi:hypothetical protein